MALVIDCPSQHIENLTSAAHPADGQLLLHSEHLPKTVINTQAPSKVPFQPLLIFEFGCYELPILYPSKYYVSSQKWS